MVASHPYQASPTESTQTGGYWSIILPATTNHPQQSDATTTGPSVPWLAAGVLLAGLGTVLLGPILPAVSARWHLTDQQTGPLFLTKFIGSFIGGIAVPRKLRLGILSGTILAAFGFAAFGLCDGLLTGSLALFIAGIGLGQIIASTNILAGYRYPRQTGSALSALNFFFAFGAVTTGLIVAAFEPRFGLRNLLLYLGAAFLTSTLAGRLTWSTAIKPGAPDLSLMEIGVPQLPAHPHQLPTPTLTHFATFLFLYGGLETCLAGWLTTFTLRYSNQPLIGGQSATILLLIALTTGRALASIALRYIRESTMQRLGLAASFISIAALTASHTATSLSLWSIFLGLSLAPFFPATFALLIHHKPTPREAGFILAVSGLGAAAFPPLMGVISTHTNSLRIAMLIPMALALLLLAISFIRTSPSTTVISTEA